MGTTLFRLFKRKSASVATVSSAMETYEQAVPHYFNPIVPLVEDCQDEIGLEMEVENADNNMVTVYPAWTSRDDGSLRNNGTEYVSVPIAGRRIHFAINQFYDNINSDCHFSPRTSIHVHLNVLDLSIDQIAVLLLTYALFERQLYAFIGSDRDKSNFCVPMYESSYKTIKYFLNNNESWQAPQLERSRYMGLNVDAVRKFGSLEFRHLEGTKNKEKLVHWINLLFRLKIYARENTLEYVKGRINKLNSDSSYQALFNDVFSSCAWYLNARDLQRECEAAVSSLKLLWAERKLLNQLAATLKNSSCWMKYLLAKEKPQHQLYPSGFIPARPRDTEREPDPFDDPGQFIAAPIWVSNTELQFHEQPNNLDEQMRIDDIISQHAERMRRA